MDLFTNYVPSCPLHGGDGLGLGAEVEVEPGSVLVAEETPTPPAPTAHPCTCPCTCPRNQPPDQPSIPQDPSSPLNWAALSSPDLWDPHPFAPPPNQALEDDPWLPTTHEAQRQERAALLAELQVRFGIPPEDPPAPATTWRAGNGGAEGWAWELSLPPLVQEVSVSGVVGEVAWAGSVVIAVGVVALVVLFVERLVLGRVVRGVEGVGSLVNAWVARYGVVVR